MSADPRPVLAVHSPLPQALVRTFLDQLQKALAKPGAILPPAVAIDELELIPLPQLEDVLDRHPALRRVIDEPHQTIDGLRLLTITHDFRNVADHARLMQLQLDSRPRVFLAGNAAGKTSHMLHDLMPQIEAPTLADGMQHAADRLTDMVRAMVPPRTIAMPAFDPTVYCHLPTWTRAPRPRKTENLIPVPLPVRLALHGFDARTT